MKSIVINIKGFSLSLFLIAYGVACPPQDPPTTNPGEKVSKPKLESSQGSSATSPKK